MRRTGKSGFSRFIFQRFGIHGNRIRRNRIRRNGISRNGIHRNGIYRNKFSGYFGSKRKDRIILLLLSILCLLLLCAAGIFLILTDRTPPVIHLPEESALVYYDGIQESELLAGVSAFDETDGDVTDSVFVERVLAQKNGSVIISYAALDSSRNIGKAKRRVFYSEKGPGDGEDANEGKAVSIGEDANGRKEELIGEDARKDGMSTRAGGNVTGDGTGGTGTGAGVDGIGRNGKSAADTQDNVVGDGGGYGEKGNYGEMGNKEIKGNKENKEEDFGAVQQLQTGSKPESDSRKPVIKLNADHVFLQIGRKFKFMDYIDEVTDDKDDYDTIWRRINVTGKCNPWIAGVYEMTYFVIDTDGYISDKVVLKVEYQ